MKILTRVFPLLLLELLAGCEDPKGVAPASSGNSSAETIPEATLEAISSAEIAREARRIVDRHLFHRDVRVRRRAALALARIADPSAVDKLLKLLEDEDPHVIELSAFGLGQACRHDPPRIEKALVRRAAGRLLKTGGDSATRTHSQVARALGYCADRKAEVSLRSWLIGPPAVGEASALALGSLSSLRNLSDATLVALLDVASRPKEPLPAALHPFALIGTKASNIERRVLEAATERLATPGPERIFAVRALSAADVAGIAELRSIASSDDFDLAERSLAIRGLSRLGAPGRRALEQALIDLVDAKLDADSLLKGRAVLLEAALSELQSPLLVAAAAARRLALWKVPEKDGALRTRVIRLRCAAARTLAGKASLSKALLACDPSDEGREGRLALVEVLGNGRLLGKRGDRWAELARSEDPVVAQAALSLLSSHAEVPEPARHLAVALGSKSPGTVAVAAHTLSLYPERGRGTSDHETKLTEALQLAFARFEGTRSVEVLAPLLDAVGALGVLSHKARVMGYCQSDSLTLREHARRALALMGDKAAACSTKQEDRRESKGVQAYRGPQETTLEFDTDVGPLTMTLDATWAPLAVQRVLTLVQDGFFENMAVHKCVPGFIVQFGDSSGDGFGAPPLAALPLELSPVPFAAFDVGMALSGQDSAQSQLFVTAGRFPELDAKNTWIGRAEPRWALLTRGDRIRSVSVKP